MILVHTSQDSISHQDSQLSRDLDYWSVAENTHKEQRCVSQGCHRNSYPCAAPPLPNTSYVLDCRCFQSNQYFPVCLRDHFDVALPADHLSNRLLFFPILLLSPVHATFSACEVQNCLLRKIMVSRMLLFRLSQVSLAKQFTPSAQIFCQAYILWGSGKHHEPSTARAMWCCTEDRELTRTQGAGETFGEGTNMKPVKAPEKNKKIKPLLPK